MNIPTLTTKAEHDRWSAILDRLSRLNPFIVGKSNTRTYRTLEQHREFINDLAIAEWNTAQ